MSTAHHVRRALAEATKAHKAAHEEALRRARAHREEQARAQELAKVLEGIQTEPRPDD